MSENEKKNTKEREVHWVSFTAQTKNQKNSMSIYRSSVSYSFICNMYLRLLEKFKINVFGRGQNVCSVSSNDIKLWLQVCLREVR